MSGPSNADLLGNLLADQRQRCAGQHVAAIDALVAKDAIIEQRKGATVVEAEKRRAPFRRPRRIRLAEPDVRGEHRKANVRADMAFLIEDRWAEAIEAEAAAAFPADAFRYAALLAFDDLVQARRAVGDGMLTHLDADVAAAHLMRDSGRGAGAEKGVENDVTWFSGDLNDSFEQFFGLGCAKRIVSREQG